MALGDLNIALVLRMISQTSGAKSALRMLNTVRTETEKTGRAGVAWSNRQLEANRARKAGLQGEALGLIGLGTSLVALTEPAIQAERRLAEISKFVEFESPDGLETLSSEIRTLVTTGGLRATAAGISDIVAAAGKLGVVDANLPDTQKRAALLAFAADASKMATAFGVSAEEAGQSLGRWQANFGMTHAASLELADTINFLGNTMATSEPEILNVFNRIGGVGKAAGLATRETAALSATILAAGASQEVAGTGAKNFLNALTRGESVTKRQQAVFNALGIDAAGLAKTMQQDATAGILSVLDAFEKIEPHRRNSMVGDLFGEEAKAAIIPLILNSQLLRQSFEKTADAQAVLGLMEEEYRRQASTIFAERQRMLETSKALAVVVGSTVLPAMNELFDTLIPVVTQISAWAEANPELVATLLKGTAAVLAFRVASVALRWSLFSLIGPFMHLTRAGSGMLMMLPRIGRGLRALKPLRWATLIPKLAWSALKVIPAIPWLALAGGGKLFKLSTLLKALKWTAKLIPGIGWAVLAGELAWNLLLKKLPWSEWIDKIDWSYWFSFSWVNELPDWSWSDLIPIIFWPMWLGFKWKDKLPVWNWADIIPPLPSVFRSDPPPSGLSKDKREVQRSITRGLSLALTPDQLVQTPVQGPRDNGGPMWPGRLYEVGERGPEWFIPDVAGTMLPTHRVKRLQQLSSDLATRVQSFAPAGRTALAPRLSPQSDVITINVHPAPGSNPDAIAAAVRRELEARDRNRQLALDDGVDY